MTYFLIFGIVVEVPMDNDYLLQITNELYKLTLLFPKKEPLRYKMRELADEILASFVSSNSAAFKNIPQKLDVLHSFFELAKNQNWVKIEEVSKLQGDYGKLIEILGQEGAVRHAVLKPKEKEEITEEAILKSPSINERERRIMEFLREKGRAQVWELKEVFPDVSKRTLRRDFRSLLKQGMITRMGERNETFYQLS